LSIPILALLKKKCYDTQKNADKQNEKKENDKK
jgi:hypothetical protein